MIHPHTQLSQVSPEIGQGVFATKRIPRGTITWIRDELDIVLPADRISTLPPAYGPLIEHYAFTDPAGSRVLCWDFGRYMNHCCQPSTVSVGVLFDIAVRDIEAGEELTTDYSLLNINGEFSCRCGVAGCRGVVKAQDLETRAAALDKAAAAATSFLSQVDQPLLPFVRESDRAELAAIFTGIQQPPSVLENRLNK